MQQKNNRAGQWFEYEYSLCIESMYSAGYSVEVYTPEVNLVRGTFSSLPSSSAGDTDRVNRANAAGVLMPNPRKRSAPCSSSFRSTNSSFSRYQESNAFEF